MKLQDTVVVRITRVSESQDALGFLEHFLDDHDRKRAERFRFPEDRARFFLGRVLLRKFAGEFFSKSAGFIELAYTDRGQPYIPQHESPRFSISHTRDLVGVALTTRSRIGLDLEFRQTKVNLMDLADRILSEKDFLIFQNLAEAEKLPAFFRVWTRKEAYLKARGEGITDGLKKISVSLAADEVVTVHDDREPGSELAWKLHTLPVPEGYAGCLACDAEKDIDLKWIKFQGSA